MGILLVGTATGYDHAWQYLLFIPHSRHPTLFMCLQIKLLFCQRKPLHGKKKFSVSIISWLCPRIGNGNPPLPPNNGPKPPDGPKNMAHPLTNVCCGLFFRGRVHLGNKCLKKWKNMNTCNGHIYDQNVAHIFSSHPLSNIINIKRTL